MFRVLATVLMAAFVGMLAAGVTSMLPASGAQVAFAAPSPMVSVTTLPQLPPVGPTQAPSQPTQAPESSGSASSSGVTSAPAGTVIQVVGDVADPRVLSLKDLQLMRRSSLTLRVLDPDGKRRVHIYSGVLLRDVISSVAPTGPGGATMSTRGFALVEGVNGDAALIGFPEFEPAFNNKQVLLAYLIDGSPLPGQAICDLIVPEDQTQGRFVSGVSTIRVGSPVP